MSLTDITYSLKDVDDDLLLQVLKNIEAVPEDTKEPERLLKQILVEVLAIGVEELMDRLDKKTQAIVSEKVGKKGAHPEVVEAVIKKNVLAFLEMLPSELAIAIAQQVGLEAVSDDVTGDLVKVQLFEEMIMAGMEGVLELLRSGVFWKMHAALTGKKAKSDRAQATESLMVKMFHLKEQLDEENDQPKPGSMRKKAGGSRRARKRGADRENQQPEEEEEQEQDEDEDQIPEEEVKSTQKRPRKTQKLFRNKTEVNSKRVAELRQFCAENQLPDEGKKADLVARVWSYVSDIE